MKSISMKSFSMKSFSMKPRILAALVAAALILSGIPAFAAETDPAGWGISGEIIKFLEPVPDAASMTVPLGTAAEDLNLPAELAALVRPPEAAAPVWPVTEEERDIPVTWQIAPEYDAGAADTYIFTAVIPQEYRLAEGALAPQVQVVVMAEGTEEVPAAFAETNASNTRIPRLEEAPVPPAAFAGPVSAAAASLTGVSVSSNIGGPPFMANRLVSVYGGKLAATPMGDGTESAAFKWYTTEAANMEDGANTTYSVKTPASGTEINGAEGKDFTVTADQFGKYIYCATTLAGTTVYSNAYRVISQPALIGDLIIDYSNNQVSAPLEDDGDASFAAADKFGTLMADAGSIRILQGENAIEAQTTVYDSGNNLLTATFTVSLADLDSFNIEVGHEGYLGILRESQGRVPTDTILPGQQSVVVMLSAGGGDGEIALTDSYVQKVIAAVTNANPDKKIVVVMRGSDGLTIDSGIVNAVAEGEAFYAGLDSANLTVNKSLLGELADKNAGITLAAESTSLPGNTNAGAMAALGSAPTVVDLSLSAGGTPVSDFAAGGAVTVQVPYTLGSSEDAADIVVYYVKDDGTAEAITGAAYADGLVTFTTTHFSTFAVGNKSSGGTSSPTPSPSGEPTTSPSARPQTPASRPSTSAAGGSSSAPAAAAPAAVPASNYGTSPQAPGLWHKVNTEVARIDGVTPVGASFNHVVNTGADILVPETVSAGLKKAGATLMMNTGAGVTFSISGGDVPADIGALNLTLRKTGLQVPPAVMTRALAGTLANRQVPLVSRADFGMVVNQHYGFGKAHAGRYANLYRFNGQSFEYLGSYQINADGQAMFGTTAGADYLVTVTAAQPNQPIAAQDAVRTGAAGAGSYTIVRGDTLSQIARRNGMSLAQLLTLNQDIIDRNRIRPGQTVRLK